MGYGKFQHNYSSFFVFEQGATKTATTSGLT